jgi:hypothetical protein
MDKRLRYIYEIANTVNGKTYIGQHTVRIGRTISSDTYWGSGKILKEAIAKYGIANFKKTIILSGEFTKDEINRLEISEISKQRKLGKAEYNISDGGESPFINSEFAKYACSKADPRKISESVKKARANESLMSKSIRYEKQKETFKKNGHIYKTKGTTGLRFSEDIRMKMSESRTGSKNGSYGTHWFTNGKENLKCKCCPEGFWAGRI